MGHYFPSVNLIFTFLIYPVLFIFSAYLFNYNFSGFVIIPFCFIMILVNDYLFRIYGGGLHDDAGRGWCELVFYLTLLTCTISLVFVMINCTKLVNASHGIKEVSFFQITRDLCFVLLLSLITLCIFHNTSIYI